MSTTRTAFGTAYFGVRDLDVARRDLERMRAQGFDWVLLPMTQDDAAWERSTFAALVDLAARQDITPVISPWGGADFGGEGIEGPLTVPEWIDVARETGAPILHVDEPKGGPAEVAGILDHWGDDATAWLTVEPYRAGLFDAGVLARPAVVGTDAYEGSVAQRAAVTSGFAATVGRLDLAWVQAFRIGRGEEALVGEAVRAMAALAPRVGVWAWRGSTGRGVLRSDRPGRVQEAGAAAIAEVHAAGPRDRP